MAELFAELLLYLMPYFFLSYQALKETCLFRDNPDQFNASSVLEHRAGTLPPK
jgi:hypothetical protein